MITEVYDVLMALEDAGLDAESNLYQDYSGRSMYGSSCFGITGTVNDAAKFLVALGEYDRGLAFDLSCSMRMDSMGRDTIIYFPGYTVDVEA